jgi:hypothetical protein
MQVFVEVMQMSARTAMCFMLGTVLAATAGTARAGDGTTQGMGPSGSTAAGSSSSGVVCKDLGTDVNFTRGSATLDTSAEGALNDVATWMSGAPDRTLKVVGFTDPTGTEELNATLSERRADATKAFLVQHGIDPSRVATAGHGEASENTALPASGRTVAIMGCAPQTPVAEETPAPVAPVEAPPPAPMTQPLPPASPYEAGPSAAWGSRFGFAMLLGGGYEQFTHTNARTQTNAGGSWDARLVFGTKFFVGAEAAYVGTANSINALGGTNATLISNGAEGCLRLNVPIMIGEVLVEPFGVGGVGFAHYSINNVQTAISDFSATADNVMTIPVGGGLAVAYKALMLDVRGMWRPTLYNDLLLSGNGNTALDHWGVGGHLGVTF